MNTAPQLSSIGKYRLIATIGHGGMAHIHLALMAGPAGFNKLLVIKALREDIAGASEEFLTMFLDEARLAARLSHPNIVQTYEVGEAAGRFFIAMEYLEGQSMKTVERRVTPGGLSMPMHLRVISEVAKGLHHAHELKGFDGEPLGVVHRDVSPHNVFLTYEGQIKLLDFGIAKAANAVHLTKVGVIKGKADYIAPEQIRGDDVDRRADVFSLGVMLWEALAGMRFAGGPEVAEITKMHNRLTGSERKLREVRPDLPAALAEICERAIALSPSARQQTALELAQAIDDYLADSSLHPNAQQLAQLISPPFVKEREQLRKLIDEQMKLALDPQANFEATTGQLPLLQRSTFTSGVWTMPQGLGGSGNTPTSVSSGFPPPLSNSQPMPTIVVGSAAPEASKKTVPWPAVMGFVVIAVAGGTYMAVRPSADDVRARAATEQPSAGALAAVPAAPGPVRPTQAEVDQREPALGRVRLHIDVSPPNATVQLDGARLTNLPFEADVVRDKSMHELQVSAPGHQPQRQMIIYDRNRSVRVSLARAEEKRRAAPRHYAAEAPSPPPTVAASSNVAPQSAASAAAKPAVELEPGMDFRRIAPSRPKVNPDVVLEEDPYR